MAKTETPFSVAILNTNRKHWKKEHTRYKSICKKFNKYKHAKGKSIQKTHYKWASKELNKCERFLKDINTALEILTTPRISTQAA